jgi:hypothetical protein
MLLVIGNSMSFCFVSIELGRVWLECLLNTLWRIARSRKGFARVVDGDGIGYLIRCTFAVLLLPCQKATEGQGICLYV